MPPDSLPYIVDFFVVLLLVCSLFFTRFISVLHFLFSFLSPSVHDVYFFLVPKAWTIKICSRTENLAHALDIICAIISCSLFVLALWRAALIVVSLLQPLLLLVFLSIPPLSVARSPALDPFCLLAFFINLPFYFYLLCSQKVLCHFSITNLRFKPNYDCIATPFLSSFQMSRVVFFRCCCYSWIHLPLSLSFAAFL